MRLGFRINSYDWAGEPVRLGATLADIVQAAERSGFDSIEVADHVWQHPIMDGPEREMLECYTTLAFLAAHTCRAKLMALVTAVPYRHPGLLAKMVTTLDVLSGGRAWLGIGTGNYEEEARRLGMPFPLVKERYEMLEETIQICLRMWSSDHGDERPFEGKHYQLQRPLNLPQSLTRLHPPILIAGDGEQKTLRLVARYADACSLRPTPELPRKLDVLRRHCDAEGRDYDAIEKTCVFVFDVGEDGSKAGELIEQLRWFARMGIQTVMGRVVHVERMTPLEVIGREVIPAIADLTVAPRLGGIRKTADAVGAWSRAERGRATRRNSLITGQPRHRLNVLAGDQGVGPIRPDSRRARHVCSPLAVVGIHAPAGIPVR